MRLRSYRGRAASPDEYDPRDDDQLDVKYGPPDNEDGSDEEWEQTGQWDSTTHPTYPIAVAEHTPAHVRQLYTHYTQCRNLLALRNQRLEHESNKISRLQVKYEKSKAEAAKWHEAYIALMEEKDAEIDAQREKFERLLFQVHDRDAR